MKPSFTTYRQKDMNRTRMTQIERINADLFIKINNPLRLVLQIVKNKHNKYNLFKWGNEIKKTLFK